MSAIAEITTESFERKVLRAGRPVLVAVCVTGSRTSQELLTLLETWRLEACGGISIVWVNAAESPEIMQCCGVPSAPGLALFSQGAVWYQFCGEISRRELDGLLTQTLLLAKTSSHSQPAHASALRGSHRTRNSSMTTSTSMMVRALVASIILTPKSG